ncbi:hypothetical protein [Comamonas sp. MYb21]|uniref:hypothetical protein n=1 Tax=Comamonas sp. MYb21 TaxID=1848648 RepID=UPI0030DC2C02
MNKYQRHIEIIEQVLWPRGINGLVVFLTGLFCALFLSNFSFQDMNDYRKIYRWHANDASIEELIVKNSLLRMKYKYKVGEYCYINSKLDAKGLSKVEVSDSQRLQLEEMKSDGKSIVVKYNPKNPSDSVYIIDPNEIYYGLFIAVFSLYSLLVYMLVIMIKLKKYIKGRGRCQ